METSPRKSEIFKFVMVRPPQEVSAENERTHFIRFEGADGTPFLHEIRDMRADGQTQAQIVAHARGFVASDSYIFSPAVAQFYPLEGVDKAARLLTARVDLPAPDVLVRELERSLGATVQDFVASDNFMPMVVSAWDSLHASVIAIDAKPENREEIMQVIRVCTVLRELANGEIRDTSSLRTRLTATPVVPKDLFGAAPPSAAGRSPAPGPRRPARVAGRSPARGAAARPSRPRRGTARRSGAAAGTHKTPFAACPARRRRGRRDPRGVRPLAATLRAQAPERGRPLPLDA